MTKSNGRRGNLYEQVLDHTRREIDEASSKIDELRQTLRLLESRVEAAKSVYAAVATRPEPGGGDRISGGPLF